MSTVWVVRIEDQDYSAESVAVLREWARNGRVQSGHYVFNPVLERWVYARDLEELKGCFTTTAAVPAGATHVCTVCHALGKPKVRVKGSFAVELVLWLLFLLPGVVYSVWRLTSKEPVCPQCGSPAMIPVRTPEGQRLIAQRGT